MSSEINWKNVVFYSVFLSIVIVLVEFFIQPTDYIRFDFLKKQIEKNTFSQHIAPERLFVNAWRITRNSYVDKSLNQQDWKYWRNRYFKNIKNMEDANVAINSMLASLNDPYSKFLLSNSFAKHKMVIDSKISGIGVLFDKTGEDIVINHVIANSAADETDVQVGDAIVSINGQDTQELEMDKIVSALASGEGEKVTITIRRNNVLITKELTKKDIFLSTIDYEINDDNIGIITLSSVMGEKTVEDFLKLIVLTNDTDGLIIDLRNNYGGILVNAIQMANYMFNEKEIISIDSRVNRKYQIYSETDKLFKEKPIVILVNNKTASAAEIFAGTLQVNLGAVVVGENTFGKNVIQQVIPMSNATGLIITTDKYILPDGRDINHVGLVPDIYVQKLSKETSKDEQMELAKKIIAEIVKKNK